MMKTYYEDKIKTALEMQSADISASDALKRRIDRELGRKEGGEIIPIALPAEKEIVMKNAEKKKFHLSGKRFVIGVAAACLLISGAAAAGKTAGYKSSIVLREPTYKSFSDLNKAEEKAGFEADAIENFENGYEFREIRVEKTDAIDENGNTLYSFPEMWIDYNKGGNHISLIISRPPEKAETTKAPNLTAQYDDTALRYDEYTYKFVPVGYELTAEDKANEQRDDYYISVGSDTVQMDTAKHVIWEKNGTRYNLMAMGSSSSELSGEEMLEMAQEILEAN